MEKMKGVKVERVYPSSPAEKAGLREGDFIISVNRHKINDVIDLMFYGNDEELKLTIVREGKKHTLSFKSNGLGLGLEVEPFKIKRCRNKCLFCFVEQLPKGLRKSLYVKDEDYRASFLYGNYITLTNLKNEDYERIKNLKLSPLYISVHATDPEVRAFLIGNYDAPPILFEIKKLVKSKIRLHCQIVLCPGINDGEILERTILDLYKFYPYISSVAVVPVGLTKYHKNGLKPVTRSKAEEVIALVEGLQRRFHRKHGVSFVYLADEFYIKASKSFPALKVYDELPQIENGVGMVPLFMKKAQRINVSGINLKNRVITFTGESFYPYLHSYIEKLKNRGLPIDLIPVKNSLFGETVTVTGLLSGEDIIKSVSPYVERGDIILVPDVTMREFDNTFIDDLGLEDLERILNVRAIRVGTEPEDLIQTLKTL